MKADRSWRDKTPLTALRRKFSRRRRELEMIEKGTLTIGPHSYGLPSVEEYAGSEAKVHVGSYTSISRGVVLVTGGNHRPDWVSTYPFRIKFRQPGAYRDGTPATKGDIRIGSDVWIGTEAMILSGVYVGDGAVVGARAVVTADVPPYGIAVGNPAKVVRYRFRPEVVEALLRIAWWTWDDEKVLEAIPCLSSPRIEEFIARFG